MPRSPTNATGADTPAVDAEWTLLCAFLVFFMQAGFALLEAGHAPAKNTLNILMKNMLDACAGVLAFYAVGFALASGDGYFAGYKHFLLIGYDNYAYVLFQFSFAVNCATIFGGSVAGRMRFMAYFTVACSVTSIIFPPVAHWVRLPALPHSHLPHHPAARLLWPHPLQMWASGGWLRQIGSNGIIDFSGSCVVHMVGGLVGLMVRAVLGVPCTPAQASLTAGAAPLAGGHHHWATAGPVPLPAGQCRGGSVGPQHAHGVLGHPHSLVWVVWLQCRQHAERQWCSGPGCSACGKVAHACRLHCARLALTRPPTSAGAQHRAVTCRCGRGGVRSESHHFGAVRPGHAVQRRASWAGGHHGVVRCGGAVGRVHHWRCVAAADATDIPPPSLSRCSARTTTAAVSALVVTLCSWLLVRFRVDDPLDAAPIHAGCGLWGLLRWVPPAIPQRTLHANG